VILQGSPEKPGPIVGILNYRDIVDLKSIPADEIVSRIRSLIQEVRKGQPVDSFAEQSEETIV